MTKIKTESANRKFDFSKYADHKAVDDIFSLIDVSGRINTIAGFVLLFMVIFSVAIPSLFSETLTPIPLTIAIIYGEVVAVGLGIMFGSAFALNQAFSNLIRVLDYTIETSERVTSDFSALKPEEQPTEREILRGINDQVTLVCIDQAVKRRLWLLGPPASWLYRATLDRLFRKAIGYLPDRENINDVDESALTSTEKQLLEELSADDKNSNLKSAIVKLSHLRSQIDKYSKPIKQWLLAPLLITFLIAAVVGIAPLVAVYFLV